MKTWFQTISYEKGLCGLSPQNIAQLEQSQNHCLRMYLELRGQFRESFTELAEEFQMP